MPRQTPLTDKERAEVRAAAKEFAAHINEECGDALSARSVPGDEYGDVEVKLNTRELPTEADGPFDFGPLFEKANELGFETMSGSGFTIADIGTANESSRLFLGFGYTYDR